MIVKSKIVNSMAILFCALFPAIASAHIDEGSFVGATVDGKPCNMMVGKQYFENGLPHPLNERIPITVDGVTFVVGHPTRIDSGKGTVGFNHDLFQGISANKTGARAVEIVMEHTEQYKGPRSFSASEDFWSEKRQTVYNCVGLKKAKK